MPTGKPILKLAGEPASSTWPYCRLHPRGPLSHRREEGGSSLLVPPSDLVGEEGGGSPPTRSSTAGVVVVGGGVPPWPTPTRIHLASIAHTTKRSPHAAGRPNPASAWPDLAFIAHARPDPPSPITCTTESSPMLLPLSWWKRRRGDTPMPERMMEMATRREGERRRHQSRGDDGRGRRHEGGKGRGWGAEWSEWEKAVRVQLERGSG